MGGFEVLSERGFIRQCSNEESLRDLLNNRQVTYYVGFDPTGSSLHAGHLVQLFAMAHLQRAGHRTIALVGGGTARIGDPSGKTETRKMLPIETIKRNAENFQKQINRFITLDQSNGLMLDNTEWLEGLNYIEFLRDIGRHFSVNRMLSFETYKMRLETGLSFIEFNYQILQSYDFLVLFGKHNCMLQLGGDDQWGNIVSGIELVRRVKGVEAFGLTTPLVTRADGKKMGKTERGALYIDPELVSPYEFYQYWVNVPDTDVEKLLCLFTFLPVEEVRKLGSLKDREINIAKQTLAFEITKIVHGEDEAVQARDAAKAAFHSGDAENLDGIPSRNIELRELKSGINIIDLFAGTDLCTSRSDARRLIGQGGAYINGENIADQNAAITTDSIENGHILLRAGKKRYFRINVS